MKGLPSFDFDVRQGWIDLSLADDLEDEVEDQRNWEWFQVPHAGHASPRKHAPKPHQQHQQVAKAKTVKVKEEDFIKQMLKEHNAKVKNARLSSASDARYAGHQTTSTKAHRKQHASDERKSSLECAWHSIPQEGLSRKVPKDGQVVEQSENVAVAVDTETSSNRRKALASPGAVSSSLSHQSPDPSRVARLVKSPHEDLQEMLDEIKAKQTPQPVRVMTQSTDMSKGRTTTVKRKLPKNDHVDLQLLVQQHNDKHKQRRLSSHASY